MAKRHEDTETGISKGDLVDRIKISSDIANGLYYITIYNGILTWKKGNKIHFFRIHGQPYLRIDENKVNQDYLGDILKIEFTAIPESEKKILEQIAKLESRSSQEEPKPEPSKSPSGTLPKENTLELPQELDLVPEPVSEPEKATPEQIARVKQLEKQIAKLESKSSQEKPEKATPEQIARVKQLEKQIAKLESQN